MLRTLVRTEIIRSGFKRVIKGSAVRCASNSVLYRNRDRGIILRQNGLFKSFLAVEPRRNYAGTLPKHLKVALPALSPTMEQGAIVSWEKKEGDKLNEGDLLAEIETDKATMGFETPEEGYLAKILIPAGTKDIPIGKTVCIIVEKKEDVAAFVDYKDDGAMAPIKTAPSVDAPGAAIAPPAAVAPPSASAPQGPPPSAPPAPTGEKQGRVFASPMAKRLAEAQKIRLEGTGTGPLGSITSKDLATMKPADAPAAGAAAVAPAKGAAPVGKVGTVGAAIKKGPVAGAQYIDIPVTNMRATIAKRLLESKITMPHCYISMDINIDKVNLVRAKLNKQLEKEKIKLSINDFVVKATAMALKRVPEANSAWLGKVIRQYTSADVCVAVSTDTGLITPIVFNADGKGLIEISKTIKDLAAKARANKLQPHEFQGGTFTVSNLGMMEVTQFCAIINPPQAAILGVGCPQKRLVMDPSCELGFRETTVMAVTISVDHRTVDGAKAAEWLKVFKSNLEDPYSMLL